MNIENYKELLLKLVEKSYNLKEIPVGSIVISNNKVIGKGFNNRQSTNKVCGHAEINAILEAERYIGDWRLDDCYLISTLKPCEMCYKVIKEARISKVYYILDQNCSYSDEVIKKIEVDNNFYDTLSNMLNDFFINLRK